jgi:feruloyl esterase
MGSLEGVKDFYRLFMVPGMGHCRGGVGPNRFDSVKVLESWVEKGIAPDNIIASHVDEKTKKVDMTRPLCPYPQKAKYTGNGSTSDAKNFYCAMPH